MRTALHTALFGLALLFAANALADRPANYFGIGLADAQFDPDKYAPRDETNLDLRLGHEFKPYLAAELRLGTSLHSDSGKGTEVSYAAGLARFNLPFERVTLYGLLGLAGGKADVPNFDDSFSGLAFGGGVALYGTERSELGIEYVQYGTSDRYRTLGVSLVHHFQPPKPRF